MESIRLNKFIAQCGVTSRRGADRLVFGGHVTVNGVKADSPGIQLVPGQDEVRLDGKVLTLPEAEARVWMLHKPIQVVTTASDPQGRKTVLDLLPAEVRNLRPYPIGRLDYFSEGLLLLTTDGDLCHRMTHPKFHQPKVYEVTVRGTVSKEAMDAMRAGMVLKGGERLAPVDIRPTPPSRGTQRIEMTLHQGVNRQIRRMFEEFGMTILKLKRIRQGSLTLGALQPGEYRELTHKEREQLLKGVRLA